MGSKDPTIEGTISGSPIFGNPHLALKVLGFRVESLGFKTSGCPRVDESSSFRV